MLFCLIAAVGFQACKNKDSDVGLKLLPDDGNINVQIVDTFTVFSYTVKEDSVKTDSLSRVIIGAMYDPEFGVSMASLYTQTLLTEINLNFGTAPVLDSVVLVMKYENGIAAYGNLSSVQELEVFKINEALVPEKQYYHTDVITRSQTPVGRFVGKFALSDSVNVNQNSLLVRSSPHLRIRLFDDFGKEFINANPSVYSSNTAFLEFFKGLAVVPKINSLAPGSGCIAPFDLTSNFSSLIVYYNDSSKKEFPINSSAQKVLLYQHPIIDPEISNQFNNPVPGDISYSQSMGAAKAKVLIPHLKNLVADGRKVVIQEASITVFASSGSVTTDYPAPLRLFLFQPDEISGRNTSIVDLIDFIFPPEGFKPNYGGSYNSQTGGYTFHFNRHLQQMLDKYLVDGKDGNRGFYITIPNDFPVTPSRLKIDNTRTKVNIIYTKL